jgi:hypothetical protein
MVIFLVYLFARFVIFGSFVVEYTTG